MDHLSFVLVTIGLPGSAPGPPSFFKSIWFSSRPFRLGTTDFSFEMRSLSFIFALSVSVLIHGAPIRRAANSSDVTVLRFADVLEQFESQFYSQALSTFQDSDFTAAGFSDAQIPIQQFTSIQSDEASHVSILESTIQSLGASPVSGCQFDFSQALSDVSTMATTARIVENLGVAAYLGAANLISDPVLLTAAASIMTVEARHQTVLNVLNGGTAIPQGFDIAFSPSEVLAIAGQFISGCDVGIPANPSLQVTNTGPVSVGTALTFSSAAINGSTDSMSCQMLIGGIAETISLPFNQCVVPQGVNGPVALYITSDDQPLDNNVRDQNTNTIVAGPAMAFIDAQSDLLSEAALSGTGSTGGNGSGSSVAGGSNSTNGSGVSGSGGNSTSSGTGSGNGGGPSANPGTNASSGGSTASASVTATASGDATTTTISPAQASAILASAAAQGVAAPAATASGTAAVSATETGSGSSATA
ncbi:hypothetical protein AcV5_000577 [Taiwanofungus camphoratus]|nr:hypothetical protein AcV5_000577 [Antrodia cinnamomea]